ncbi:SGNH hydrolase domain-containing protein, partial [Alphaproteobacteria bacterium]|nr:SGNH hydrolase domain-containing protein [Alphaproteobacteria bacterium]
FDQFPFFQYQIYKFYQDYINKQNNIFKTSFPYWDGDWEIQESCTEKMGPQFSQFCVSTNINKKPDILIIGDSVSNHLYPGMKNIFPNKVITQIGKGACVPALGLETRLQYNNIYQNNYNVGCAIIVKQIINYIQEVKPEIIIISFLGPMFLNGKKDLDTGNFIYKGHYFNLLPPNYEPTEDKLHLLKNAFIKTLNELPKSSKIYFVDSPPRLTFDPIACIHVNKLFNDKTFSSPECSIDKKIYKKDLKDYEIFINNLVKIKKNIVRVKIDDLTCNDQKCFSTINGLGYYRDRVHFSEYGSIKIAERIKEKFTNLLITTK